MDRAARLRRGPGPLAARVHRDERGQSLVVVLSLLAFLFLVGSAMAAHASVALRTTTANEGQAGDFHAADAGVELGIWWQRNGRPGDPPATSVNGLTVTATVASSGTPCATPSPVRLTGFEHGAVSTSGGGLFSAATGTGLTADAAVARTGAYSLKVSDAAGSANNGSLPIAAGTAVVRVYLRLASLPAADVNELLLLDAAARSDLRLGYQASSQRLTLRFGAAAATLASTVIGAGIWYRIELRLVASANPRTADWRIDGVAQTPTSWVGTASTVSTMRLGSTVAADVFTANYDDILVSATSGDYPLGAGTVEGLRPDAVGTSSGSGSFRDDDGTAIDPTSYLRLDDSPMTGLADYVRQQTVGVAEYVEVTFGDTTATCVVGVAGLVAYHAAGTTADRGKTSIFDGATERIVYSADMSEASLFYRSAIVAPAAAPWTPGAVNALKARVGYSTDVTPNPYWDALLLEVATGVVVPGTITVSATAGGSTVTATYQDVGAAPPMLLTWSADR